jgi:hypothetical protein
MRVVEAQPPVAVEAPGPHAPFRVDCKGVLVSAAYALDGGRVNRSTQVVLAFDVGQVPFVNELRRTHLTKPLLARADDELTIRAMPQDSKLRVSKAIGSALIRDDY